ncbi:MAG: DUF2784 domain-containing protein [Spirochaetia bacterium]
MFSAALFADFVVAFHFGYLLFTLGGELLILLGAALHWQWIHGQLFRLLHLIAVLLVAVEALIGYLCPLTQLEHFLRTRAGQQVETEISFVGRLIRSVLFYDFPGWFFTALYIAFGLLVLITYICIPPRRNKQ